MKVISQQLRLSATDLSNHLACHHLSVLDLSVAKGARKSPEWKSPDLEIIRHRNSLEKCTCTLYRKISAGR